MAKYAVKLIGLVNVEAESEEEALERANELCKVGMRDIDHEDPESSPCLDAIEVVEKLQ
jgi:hypothetical protein